MAEASIVIVAAGRGTRMGKGDKLFFEVAGLPLVGHTWLRFDRFIDSTEVVMMLKAVAPGSLANDNDSGLGEFMIQGILDDSTVVYISKIFNNTVHYVTAGGATGSAPYVRNAEGTDEGQVSGKVNINVL